MLVATILPADSDVLTMDEVIQLAAENEMVLCAPTNFDPARPFKCTCFPPDRIPHGFRRVIVAIKTPTKAVLDEPPCAA